jgi:hypothetical protein
MIFFGQIYDAGNIFMPRCKIYWVIRGALLYKKPKVARILKILEALVDSDFSSQDVFCELLCDNMEHIQSMISKQYIVNERLTELFSVKLCYSNLQGGKEEMDIISFAKLFCSKDTQRELLKIKLRIPPQKPDEETKSTEQSFAEMVTKQRVAKIVIGPD